MEFKDLPISIQEMAADVIRSQLARNPMILVDKVFIRNLSNHVRNSFTGLYSDSFTNNHCVENKAKPIAETITQNINTKPTEEEIDQFAHDAGLKKTRKKNRHMRETCLFMTTLSEFVAKFRLNTWQTFIRHYLKIWKQSYLMATPTAPSVCQRLRKNGIQRIAGMLPHGYSATKLLPWKLRRVFATC